MTHHAAREVLTMYKLRVPKDVRQVNPLDEI
jgi:hypothetical protein